MTEEVKIDWWSDTLSKEEKERVAKEINAALREISKRKIILQGAL